MDFDARALPCCDPHCEPHCDPPCELSCDCGLVDGGEKFDARERERERMSGEVWPREERRLRPRPPGDTNPVESPSLKSVSS